MKTEKVVYQITRHKIAMVEVQTEQEKEIVENLNRDFERTDKANKTFTARCSSLEAMQEDNGFDIIDETESPEERMLENERRAAIKERIHKALKQLNPRQQEMVQMVYFEEKSQDEVADYFGISKSAVSHAMARIYAAMKKFLNNF